MNPLRRFVDAFTRRRGPRLVYAAYACCSCGLGLAHRADAPPYGDEGYWDCSGILLGTADPAVRHTARLPFVFYEIKSERQPSAEGATTRPPA